VLVDFKKTIWCFMSEGLSTGKPPDISGVSGFKSVFNSHPSIGTSFLRSSIRGNAGARAAILSDVVHNVVQTSEKHTGSR
jgi:hypothetical protein